MLLSNICKRPRHRCLVNAKSPEHGLQIFIYREYMCTWPPEAGLLYGIQNPHQKYLCKFQLFTDAIKIIFRQFYRCADTDILRNLYIAIIQASIGMCFCSIHSDSLVTFKHSLQLLLWMYASISCMLFHASLAFVYEFILKNKIKKQK